MTKFIKIHLHPPLFVHKKYELMWMQHDPESLMSAQTSNLYFVPYSTGSFIFVNLSTRLSTQAEITQRDSKIRFGKVIFYRPNMQSYTTTCL